ncbi:MAG: hypothetical protein HYY90_05435, partial [Candidatus Omnitrophica bacterium]|nr:hypothetical protein [Candidatus Omnitrophota bacterium]
QFGGGGSGGSIWIAAGALTGAGTISANGGRSLGGGGGGGRIALTAENSSGYAGQITASAGAGGSAAAGTIVKPRLVIAVQPPASVAAGAAFSLQVAVQDEDGTTITSDNASVFTIARATGTGTLQGTLTKTVSAGVAGFTGLSYTKAEGCRSGMPSLQAPADDTP